MDWQVFWIILLVVTNAFFVASQFALINTRSSYLDAGALKGSKTAEFIKTILKNLDRYLITTQIGIGLSTLSMGWLAYSYLNSSYNQNMQNQANDATTSGAFFLVFFILAFVVILLGAIIPKFIAIYKPLKVMQLFSYPLYAFYWLFSPLVYLFNFLTKVALRAFGLKDNLSLQHHSYEEIQIVLEQGKDSGVVDTKEYELIQKVFDFSERMVKSIMVPRNKISAIEMNCSLDELMEMITNESYSRIPIYEEDIDKIVGIIHTKDLFTILQKNLDFDINTISRRPYFIPETKKINDLMTEMQQHRIQVAIVLDEFGGTAGIVTLEDIMEELVGEIQDEYDEENPIVEKISSKEYMIDATANVHDVNLFLPFELPESGEYDTISGLVGELFDKIPDVGEHKFIAGYNLIIMKKSQQNIDFVKLEVLDNADSSIH